MSISVNRKTFGLKSERDCISAIKSKEKYMAYQDEYREHFGVFPELDKVNNPFTAQWNDAYEAYVGLQKRGIYGDLWYHDLHGFFKLKLRKIYNLYQREWSFLSCINYSYRTLFDDLREMAPQKRIQNNLGFLKDENGNYYEGTWQNDRLVYGLVYLADNDTFFIGYLRKNGLAQGVSAKITSSKKQITAETLIGSHMLKNNALRLYDSLCLELTSSIRLRNGEIDQLESITASVGNYDEGYAHGKFYDKEISDNIRIGWRKYKDGDLKSSMNVTIAMFCRLFMVIAMLEYFFLKYTYGLLVFPIYRAICRKNWL